MDKIIKFKTKGMSCKGCEDIIKNQALKIDGVKGCKVDYATEVCEITFDSEKTSLKDIFKSIEGKGYECLTIDSNKSSNDYGSWIFGVMGILVAGYFILKIVDKIPLPEISPNISYGLLFLVGLLTGFHCVTMCGSFVVSYTARQASKGIKSYKSHLMYGLGKTISYTIIGAAFGLLGSFIAFTPKIRGIVGIFAGVFLILFGAGMIVPFLRKFRINTPESLTRIIFKKFNASNHTHPFVFGLLNGLMIACGPLQAVYVMAAGTGSMVEGAKVLLIFGLGTLPIMFAFGSLTSFVSTKITNKILKVSGVIVILLGLVMLNRGLALMGTGYDIKTLLSTDTGDEQLYSPTDVTIKDGYQEIQMTVDRNGWHPDKFVLKKGVPVKWTIEGKEITSCNKAIQVPKLGLSFSIKRGKQIIEFTPNEEGNIPWSCWMGMIPGTFIVKNNPDFGNLEEIQKELKEAELPKKRSCGCGG